MEAELAVRVQPRAPRAELVGERAGRLVVRVTAPPESGRANEALRSLLARRLRIARGRVTIVRGKGARDKLVRIEGMTLAEARSGLGLPE